MIILPDYTSVIKFFEMILNSEHRTKKLKTKDTGKQKVKTEKDENLALPKE